MGRAGYFGSDLPYLGTHRPLRNLYRKSLLYEAVHSALTCMVPHMKNFCNVTTYTFAFVGLQVLRKDCRHVCTRCVHIVHAQRTGRRLR